MLSFLLVWGKTYSLSCALIGLVSIVSQWMSRVRGVLGWGVWAALHSVRPTHQTLFLTSYSCLSADTPIPSVCPQIWKGGQGEACGEGSAGVARHHWVSNRNRYAIHAVQGRLQQEEQPAESGHHQIQQSLHRDCRVYKQRWGEGQEILFYYL